MLLLCRSPWLVVIHLLLLTAAELFAPAFAVLPAVLPRLLLVLLDAAALAPVSGLATVSKELKEDECWGLGGLAFVDC